MVMKVVLQRKTLLNSMEAANRVAARKSSIPVLGQVKAEVQDGRMRLLASDLDNWLVVEMLVGEYTPGACIFPTALVIKLLRGLDDENVVVEVVGHNAIKVGPARLFSTPPEEFPVPPKGLGFVAEFDGESLVEVLKGTVFASSTDETKYILNGVFLAKGGCYVATDGHRLIKRKGPAFVEELLAHVKVDKDHPKLDGLILNKHGTLALIAFLEKHFKGEACKAGISENGQQLCFQVGPALLQMKLIDGRFPDYNEVIPLDLPVRMSVDRKEFEKKLRLAMNLSEERNGATRFSVNGALRIFCQNPDRGEIQLDVEGAYIEGISGGKTLKAGFNGRYLLDACAHLPKSTHVHIGLQDEQSPITLDSDKNAVCVIMPMRL